MVFQALFLFIGVTQASPLLEQAKEELIQEQTQQASPLSSATIDIKYDIANEPNFSPFRFGLSLQEFTGNKTIEHKAYSRKLNESDLSFSPLIGLWLEYHAWQWRKFGIGLRAQVEHSKADRRLSEEKFFDDIRVQYFNYQAGPYVNVKIPTWSLSFQLTGLIGTQTYTQFSGSQILKNSEQNSINQLRASANYNFNEDYSLFAEAYYYNKEIKSAFGLSVSVF